MIVLLSCEVPHSSLCVIIIVLSPQPMYEWTLVEFEVVVDHHKRMEGLSVENRLQTNRLSKIEDHVCLRKHRNT